MISVNQPYMRLFRPWDVCDDKQTNEINSVTITDTKHSRKKLEVDKRENRLRKIRGTFKKTEVDQDATVSTTTETEDEKRNLIAEDNRQESPVQSLSLCCDRLLKKPEKDKKVDTSKSIVENPYPPIFPHVPSQSAYNVQPGLLPDYLPTVDIAQALGVPPSDPLLLESLAQGYAMELEYARILHQENEAKLLNSRKQRPKKYKCPHCQVGFSNNGQLKGHIRIHTGERPYKCDEKNCGKTFTRNEELTRHKRIHSGVRPFPCPTCGKKFGRRDHLKKHTKTHFLQAERMMPVFVPLSAVQHINAFPYLYSY